MTYGDIMFYQYNHLGSPDYLKIEKNSNFSFPTHLHQCFEVVVILSGEMTIKVDEKHFVLKEKDALLIFPNQIHSLESTESEHILCIFSPKLVQAYAAKISDKLPHSNKFKPDDYLVNALANLELSSSSVDKKGVLYSLCGQFDKTASYYKKQIENEKILYKIFLFVETNFSNDCSLSKLSKETGYDYSYLSRYFKKATGISFNSYVMHYRLSHACYLLENTSLPILQCAYDSGFVSLRSFNRCFKENFQNTPTQYRKNIIQNL